ncbi:alcohol dehydrogenase [Trifolium repens]|nr:alcohol dehydrogenase [Trifolium repens]
MMQGLHQQHNHGCGGLGTQQTLNNRRRRSRSSSSQRSSNPNPLHRSLPHRCLYLDDSWMAGIVKDLRI